MVKRLIGVSRINMDAVTLTRKSCIRDETLEVANY